MLEKLRNAGQSWVAKLLMALLAASFGLWGIADMLGGSTSNVLAAVGNQKVMVREYENAFNRAQRLYAQRGQTVTREQAKALGYDRAILDELINLAALDEQAEKMRLHISPQVVVEAAAANPNFQGVNGAFDPAMFNRALQNQGLSENAYIALETERLRREAIISAVAGNMLLPMAGVQVLKQFQDERRNASYFTITINPADLPPPTEEAVKAQYDKTPAAYTAPEYRSVAVLIAEASEIAKTVIIKPEDLQAAYEKYKGEYARPERRTILQIAFPNEAEAQTGLAKLKAGTSFEDLAKQRGLLPEDYTLSEKTKADLLDPAVADAAFNLSQGATSDVVKGGLVTAILKVQNITLAEPSPSLDSIKPQLTARLQLAGVQAKLQDVYDNVENDRTQQIRLEDIAKNKDLRFQLIPAVSAQGLDKEGKPVLLPNQQALLAAVFTSDVGDDTAPLTRDDVYIWYDVREVFPSALRPFNDVKKQVTADVAGQNLRTALQARAEKIIEGLKGGADFSQTAAQEKAAIKTAQGLGREQPTADFDPLALSSLFALPDKGFGWSVDPAGQTARIIRVDSIALPAFDLSTDEVKTMRQNLSAGVGAALQQSYARELARGYKVVINENLWAQATGSGK